MIYGLDGRRGRDRRKFEALSAVMNEWMRRLGAGAEAEFGDGGIAVVERATGPGGGRTPIEDRNPELVTALEALVDPVTRDDPL